MSVTVTVEHNGKTYSGELCTITSTFLGVEDHGCFTASLSCSWPGGGVSVGNYLLDAWSEPDGRRIGTAYGLDHIKAILETIGVHKWEQLKDRRAIVLFDGHGGHGGPGSMSVGIASADGDRVLIFAEHLFEWQSRTSRTLLVEVLDTDEIVAMAEPCEIRIHDRRPDSTNSATIRVDGAARAEKIAELIDRLQYLRGVVSR